MKTLLSTNVDPSCGWCFYISKTQYTVKETNYRTLVQTVKRHLSVNKIPIHNELEYIIQNQIAVKIDPRFSEERNATDK